MPAHSRHQFLSITSQWWTSFAGTALTISSNRGAAFCLIAKAYDPLLGTCLPPFLDPTQASHTKSPWHSLSATVHFLTMSGRLTSRSFSVSMVYAFSRGGLGASRLTKACPPLFEVWAARGSTHFAQVEDVAPPDRCCDRLRRGGLLVAFDPPTQFADRSAWIFVSRQSSSHTMNRVSSEKQLLHMYGSTTSCESTKHQTWGCAQCLLTTNTGMHRQPTRDLRVHTFSEAQRLHIRRGTTKGKNTKKIRKVRYKTRYRLHSAIER